MLLYIFPGSCVGLFPHIGHELFIINVIIRHALFLVKMHIRFVHTLTPRISKAKLTKRDQSLWWVYQGVDRRLTVPQFAWRKKRGLAVVERCPMLYHIPTIGTSYEFKYSGITRAAYMNVWVGLLFETSFKGSIDNCGCLFINTLCTVYFSFHRYTYWSIFCFLLTTIKPQI